MTIVYWNIFSLFRIFSSVSRLEGLLFWLSLPQDLLELDFSLYDPLILRSMINSFIWKHLLHFFTTIITLKELIKNANTVQIFSSLLKKMEIKVQKSAKKTLPKNQHEAHTKLPNKKRNSSRVQQVKQHWEVTSENEYWTTEK